MTIGAQMGRLAQRGVLAMICASADKRKPRVTNTYRFVCSRGTPIHKRSGRLTPRERETPGRISSRRFSHSSVSRALNTFLIDAPFYAALMTRFAIAVGAPLKKVDRA